jgi:hypothetical protein
MRSSFLLQFPYITSQILIQEESSNYKESVKWGPENTEAPWIWILTFSSTTLNSEFKKFKNIPQQKLVPMFQSMQTWNWRNKFKPCKPTLWHWKHKNAPWMSLEPSTTVLIQKCFKWKHLNAVFWNKYRETFLYQRFPYEKKKS